MNPKPTLLFYCQHSLGLGHLVRSIALADGLAEYFGQPAADEPPLEFHLPEAILRVDESLTEQQVVHVPRIDVGHAPGVAEDLHRRGHR